MTATFDQTRHRFLAGFAAQANLDPEKLTVSGTTLAARADRKGTGVVSCYWVGRHAVVWLDPDLMDSLAGLRHETDARSAEQICDALITAGFKHIATADMRVLDQQIATPADGSVPPPAYRLEHLAPDGPETLTMIRELAKRCDPDEVEEAGLEDLDNFAERAIFVLTVESDKDRGARHVVAYASACDWEWDDGFTDVGVLVDSAHRGLGLGRCVVDNTVRQLLKEGRLPLYRHGHANVSSQAIAVGLGFRPATTLAFYQLDKAESSSSEPDE